MIARPAIIFRPEDHKSGVFEPGNSWAAAAVGQKAARTARVLTGKETIFGVVLNTVSSGS